MKHVLRRWGRRLQGGLIVALWKVAGALSPAAASSLGARIMALIGPLQRKHRHIRRNLAVVHPQASDSEIEDIARQVWRNFGRVVFEYPHLPELFQDKVKLTIAPETQRLFDTGEPVALLSAHVGNWELLAYLFDRDKRHITVVYGPQDSPWIDERLAGFRRPSGSTWIPKNEALRELNRRALNGSSVAFLPDVRVDTGVVMPLFGKPAPTTISPARIALRLGYPCVPARVTRHADATFELELLAPIEPAEGSKGKAAAVSVTEQYNRILEKWIAERPGEWHCLKRRWPKDVYPC